MCNWTWEPSMVVQRNGELPFLQEERGTLVLAGKGNGRRGRDHLDKGLVWAGSFREHVKKHWRGTCEGLERADSATGVSAKRERGDHTVAWEDIAGSDQVKHESRKGEGKRWITGCQKIGGWTVRTKRVVSPSKETGIALRSVRDVNWEGHTYLSSAVPKYL